MLHCRLLIKKRTGQISVLLFEWTREKHNRSLLETTYLVQFLSLNLELLDLLVPDDLP